MNILNGKMSWYKYIFGYKSRFYHERDTHFSKILLLLFNHERLKDLLIFFLERKDEMLSLILNYMRTHEDNIFV